MPTDPRPPAGTARQRSQASPKHTFITAAVDGGQSVCKQPVPVVVSLM